ncbi:unnamed protein product [Phyllotreta striolata]|uniref:Uncharacterized protein n=1 Tax=Phyllotreta striolata TaxID=444603 RepID=A0A9N9THP5_PHYSR|nr:unnamed protein product [Phyllotreta striolata]
MNVQTASRRRRDAVERRRRSRRTPHDGVSTLMYAAQQGDVDVVRRIIGVRRSPISNTILDRDRTGKTALHYSSTSQRRTAAETADLLVMAAPDLIDGTDEDGFTPLHLAVIAGNMQLVNFLLANGADVDALDNERHTVVHWATVCGETSALRAVLTAGARVSTPDVHGGYPLHYAAQMGAGEKDSDLGLQVLRLLLAHPGAEVACEDSDGRQPLLWAASSGSAGAVLALIRAGAAVEAADKDGLTALHCAASRGHTDCLDTLLTLCGASVDVIDSNGCTALHYAVTLGHADATALLLAHGADPNRQDRKGRSPAHCGCAKGQFETVKLIGNRGANLWLRNARGDFPLHDAAASGRRDLVKWLLEMRPSQTNARNNDGKCPLHAAASNDNSDMCKVPSGKYKGKKGTIKEAMSYFQETIDDATDYLMTNINTNIIISSNILLDAGAEVNPILRTSKNTFVTPLDCALQKGHRSTAKFLQVHGGVPASRLSDLDAPPLSLRIRDDVTLYGGSSSENENRRKPDGKAKLTKQKSSKDEKKRTPTGRMDYTNEITINGRLNFNGIVIDNKESVQTQTSARPKSAKYGKFRDRSAQSSINKEIMVSISSQASVSKTDHATNTSEEPPRTLPDEASFTSEDQEEPKKEIVVEASVHPLPKSPLVVEESCRESKVTIETQIEVDETREVVKIEEEEEDVKMDEGIESGERKPEEDVKDGGMKEGRESSERVKTEEDVKEGGMEEGKVGKRDANGSSKEIIISEDKATNLVKKKEENVEINDVRKDAYAEGSVEKEANVQLKKEKIEDYSDSSVFSDEEDSLERTHRSFRVLKDKHPNDELQLRSRSLETINKEKLKRSKIPTPLLTKRPLSKSDRNLHQTYKETDLDLRVPSLPNISRARSTRCSSNADKKPPRCTSNVDKHPDSLDSDADVDDAPKGKNKRLVKRRSKASRGSRSAGSDYESSNLIDSGFEPSPRSTRAPPKWRNVSDRGVNMTTVTQTIQSNIRRYHLERKIFQQLLELKRHQIRVGQHDEAVLVKRAIDAYHKTCAATVGVGRYDADDYTFKSFERFLYEALRRLQKAPGEEILRGLPARGEHPLRCTRSTNRCGHAAHAYTGVPCAAYLPKMDHHTIPKIGFDDSTECRPGTGCFLPTINPKKPSVTLELSRGDDKQVICLPTNKLDQNKRYYVTFTVKDDEKNAREIMNDKSAHMHSKSD